MDRPELAAFLLAHRERLRPSDVGLPNGPRRRTRGLRREEVALLAAMSVDYYIRLEQRRGPQPSVQMLASIARALRLTADERDYLYRVAGHSAPDRTTASDHVEPALLLVLDRLSDTPASILSALEETLVQNDLSRALVGDARALTGWDRSSVYRWFIHPDLDRPLYPAADHERQSRARAASLRAAYGSMGADSRAGELVRILLDASPEFARLWEAREVARRFEDHKTLLHPELGPLELDCQALFTEDESQALLVLTAAPGSETEDRLRLLSVLGTQEFATGP